MSFLICLIMRFMAIRHLWVGHWTIMLLYFLMCSRSFLEGEYRWKSSEFWVTHTCGLFWSLPEWCNQTTHLKSQRNKRPLYSRNDLLTLVVFFISIYSIRWVEPQLWACPIHLWSPSYVGMRGSLGMFTKSCYNQKQKLSLWDDRERYEGWLMMSKEWSDAFTNDKYYPTTTGTYHEW